MGENRQTEDLWHKQGVTEAQGKAHCQGQPHWGKREPRLKGFVKVKTGKDKIGAWPLDCAGYFYRWTWGDKGDQVRKGVKTVVMIMTVADTAEPVAALALRLWFSREPGE